MNLTYLIGNGFDIGLGLKTDYCAPDTGRGARLGIDSPARLCYTVCAMEVMHYPRLYETLVREYLSRYPQPTSLKFNEQPVTNYAENAECAGPSVFMAYQEGMETR